MPKRVITRQDDSLRLEVVQTIIASVRQDPELLGQKAWVRRAAKHKELLQSLFSGQGINRIGRVVAWLRREQIGQRRIPAEVLCLLVDAMAAGAVPGTVENALAFLGFQEPDDLLRMAMLDANATKVLLLELDLYAVTR